MSRNSNREWTFFNREYLPLGWNSDPFGVNDREKQVALFKLPIYTSYKGLTNAKLIGLAHHEEHGVQRDEGAKL